MYIYICICIYTYVYIHISIAPNFTPDAGHGVAEGGDMDISIYTINVYMYQYVYRIVYVAHKDL